LIRVFQGLVERRADERRLNESRFPDRCHAGQAPPPELADESVDKIPVAARSPQSHGAC
jgi:hypothetical protein